ncbi:MAG: Phosphoribosylformylglycinamidine synthase, glutamine amidotransferase subunit, partial [uncultured Gemmatimonadetes bacterium]
EDRGRDLSRVQLRLRLLQGGRGAAAGRSRVPVAQGARPAGGGRRLPARRLQLRRLPALRGHRRAQPHHARSDRVRRGGRSRRRHLQRLPDPLRERAAAGRPGPQPHAEVPLARRPSPGGARGSAVHVGVRGGTGAAHSHRARRGVLHRRSGGAGRAGGERAGGVPLLRRGRQRGLRGQPQRQRAQHRGHRERRRQRAGNDAAPGACGRPAAGQHRRRGGVPVAGGTPQRRQV